MSKNNNTQKIVGLGLFTAIVIVLQLMGSFIRFGTFSISLAVSYTHLTLPTTSRV